MLQIVAGILRSRGIQGWLVGGSVRDRELGRPSPDLDLVVAGDPASVAEEIARKLGSPWFALSERHGAYRVMGPEGHIDVAALRGESILDDLAQRDFTVNAMAAPVGGGRGDADSAGVAGGGPPARTEGAVEPGAGPRCAAGAGSSGESGLIDPYGGLADLREGRLVAVSEHIFVDDPLRLMRAVRFSHVLGLALDSALAAAVRAQAPLLTHAAPERLAAEMVLTLAAGRSGDAVRLWGDLGLLKVMLPEREAAADATPMILDRLEQLLAESAASFPEAADALAGRLAQPVDGAVERPAALRLAGLVVGMEPEQAAAAGRRLRLSSAVTSLLECVAHATHDRGGAPPAPLELARPGQAAILYLWAAAPWEPEVIMLTAVARTARTATPDGPDPSALPEAARSMMALWARRSMSGVPPLPVDGELLMRELGLTPGPRLGVALRTARLAWEAGEASDADQLLAVAREAVGEGDAARGRG